MLSEQCCQPDVSVAEATNEAIGLQLRDHLQEVFGDCKLADDGKSLDVSVDGNVASINLRSFEVECPQPYLAKAVRQTTKWFVSSLEPPKQEGDDEDDAEGEHAGKAALQQIQIEPAEQEEATVAAEEGGDAADAAAGGAGGADRVMDDAADPATVVAAEGGAASPEGGATMET